MKNSESISKKLQAAAVPKYLVTRSLSNAISTRKYFKWSPPKRAFFHWKGNLLKKLWVDPDGKALTFIASFFHHENFFFAGLQMKFPRTGLQVFSPMVISESNHACNHSYNLQINDLSNAMIYTLRQNVSTSGSKLRFASVWWLYGLMNGFGFPLSFPIYQEIEFLARFLLNFLLSGNVTVSDVWFS